VALLVLVVVDSPKGDRVRNAVAWSVGVFVSGGFWFLRNLGRTGSPVPLLDLGVGSLRLPKPPLPAVDALGHPVIGYVTDIDVWRSTFRPGVPLALGRVGWVLVALAGISLGWALWRGSARVRSIALVACAAFLSYVLNPLGAFGPEGNPSAFFFTGVRYAVPGLLIAMYAGVLYLSPRWRVPMAVLAAVLIAVTQLTGGPFPGWIREYRARGVVVALAVVLVALAPLCAVLVPRSRRWVLAPLLAGTLGAFVLAGAHVGDRYLEARYTTDTPAFARSSPFMELFRRVRTLHDQRIGYVWMEADFPLYGDDLSNHPRYVGISGPHGAFRDARSCREWRTAVNNDKLDLLVVAPLSTAPFVGPPPMLEWTEGAAGVAPEFRIDDIHVYRVTGLLDPDACPA
jgi:hypothetical protein